MKSLSLFLLLSLFSCTLEPKYDIPSVPLSEAWKTPQTEGEVASKREENWWEVFHDETLTAYMKRAIECNQDLIAAQERVEQARDLAKIARSKLFPWFNLSFGYSNQEELTQIYGPGIPYNPFVLREHQLEYALPVTMNYEIDVWGKIRSAYKSANLNESATQEAYRFAMLGVTTELANAYFQIRILDALAAIYEGIVETRKQALEIETARYQKELINYSAVAVSDQDLNQFEARYFEVKQRRAIFENMMGVLLGTSSSEFKMGISPLNELPPEIPQGVPAEILLRRPDLAEQQRRMESIHALLGVSYANYFPSIDVQAGGGSLSPLMNYFFKGLSSFWMIGTNITEVIFDGLAREYKVKLTWAQFRESVANYRQAALSAFQEVENSLSNLVWIGREMERISQAVEAAKTDSKIASDRFTFGVSSYLPAADKQKVELDNEGVYLTMLGFRYMNTIQLIRALGGGW